MFPVTTLVGRLVVLGVAIAVLIGFLVWSKRTASSSFFFGALAGTGLVLSFDVIWGPLNLRPAPPDQLDRRRGA